MTDRELILLVLLILATIGLIGLGVWCQSLLAMTARLAQQSARMRRRAIRAEGRALLLTRAIEDYAVRMEQASQGVATRSAGDGPSTLVLRPSSGANRMYVTPHGEDLGAA